MREHKYRAWHPRNEAFEYWTLSDFWRNGWICCSHTEPIVPCSFPSDTYGSFAVLADWEEYTGLKDKNGREIYEGDIIGWANQPDGKPFWVIYSEANTRFEIAIPASPYFGPGLGVMGSDSYEVIGNIHENTALLGHNPGPSAE